MFPGDAQQPYLEEDPTGPLSAYGRTKLAGEQRFLEATTGLGAIVRTSWLYGVHGKSFPATMLKLFAEREVLKVVEDQRGRPTFTKDLARALADVATRKLAGTWHFANSGEVTWHGFAEGIRERASRAGCPSRCAPSSPSPRARTRRRRSAPRTRCCPRRRSRRPSAGSRAPGSSRSTRTSTSAAELTRRGFYIPTGVALSEEQVERAAAALADIVR